MTSPLHTLQMYTSAPRWGISYSTNSYSPRAKKWYRVARLAYIDSGWFELYWHPDHSLRDDNVSALRKRAKQNGLDLAPGLFRSMNQPKRGSEMEHVA